MEIGMPFRVRRGDKYERLDILEMTQDEIIETFNGNTKKFFLAVIWELVNWINMNVIEVKEDADSPS